ncbi:MAG: NYN domain-containing protein, partial [Eubacteriales bacterium]|nr:NYN domain-containing protein [Eubacteriales bacterium]
ERWLNTLENKIPNFEAVRCPMKKRIGDNGSPVYCERGNDVDISIAMYSGAVEGLYDIAILIASDSDFQEMVQKVRALGKRVEYVNFKEAPAFVLSKKCSCSLLLDESYLLNCWRA